MQAHRARAALTSRLLDPGFLRAPAGVAMPPPLCAKGEASPEGFRPAHRGLQAALAQPRRVPADGAEVIPFRPARAAHPAFYAALDAFIASRRREVYAG